MNEIRESIERVFDEFFESVSALIQKTKEEFLALAKSDGAMAFEYIQNMKSGSLSKDNGVHWEILEKVVRHLAHFQKQNKPRHFDSSNLLQTHFQNVKASLETQLNALLHKATPKLTTENQRDFIIDPIKLDNPRLVFTMESRVCIANRGMSLNQRSSGNLGVIDSKGNLKVVKIKNELETPLVSAKARNKKSLLKPLVLPCGEYVPVFEKCFGLMNAGYHLVSFSPNGERLLVTGYEDGPIVLLNSKNGADESSIAFPSSKILNALWISNSLILFAIEKGLLIGYDLELSQNSSQPKKYKPQAITTMGNDICHMIQMPTDIKDSFRVICGDTLGFVFCVEFSSGSVLWKRKAHSKNVSFISENGKGEMASGGIDNYLVVISFDNLEEKFRKPLNSPVIGLGWTPCGKFLVVGSREELCIVDAENEGMMVSSLFLSSFCAPLHLQSFVVDWSLQSIFVGTRETDGTGRVWKVGLWELNNQVMSS